MGLHASSAVVITTYFSVVRCVQSQIYYNIQFVCRSFFPIRWSLFTFSPIPITLLMPHQCTIASILFASAKGSEWTQGFVLYGCAREHIWLWFNKDVYISVAKEEAYRCSKVSNTSIICEKWFEKSHQYFAFAYTFNGTENLSFALLTQTVFFISLWRLFTVHWIQIGGVPLLVWFDLNVSTVEEEEAEKNEKTQRDPWMIFPKRQLSLFGKAMSDKT